MRFGDIPYERRMEIINAMHTFFGLRRPPVEELERFCLKMKTEPDVALVMEAMYGVELASVYKTQRGA